MRESGAEWRPVFGRERAVGAALRDAIFLGSSRRLDAAWFRSVQRSGVVAHQDPSSSVLHLAPFALDKAGPLVVAVASTAILARLDDRSTTWCGG